MLCSIFEKRYTQHYKPVLSQIVTDSNCLAPCTYIEYRIAARQDIVRYFFPYNIGKGGGDSSVCPCLDMLKKSRLYLSLYLCLEGPFYILLRQIHFFSSKFLCAIGTAVGEHFSLHDSGIRVSALPPDLTGGRVRRHPRFVLGILLYVALGWGRAIGTYPS